MRTSIRSFVAAIALSTVVFTTVSAARPGPVGAQSVTQTIFSATNVHPAATSAPGYYYPSAAGLPVPTGWHQWTLDIDQTNIPGTASYQLAVEYERKGVWQLDEGCTCLGGFVADNGNFIQELISGIGSQDANGNIINYPDHVRVHIISYGGWILPSLTLTLS